MAKKLSIPLTFILVISLLVLGLTFLTHQSARADGNIIYVDADATGAASGLTWSDAYTNVQDGLAAATSGYDVWVAEGVYYPDKGSGQTDNSQSSTFSLNSGVALYGGFAATETLLTQRDWNIHITVLSADIDGNDTTDAYGVVTTTSAIAGNNAYHVLYSENVDSTARLDGFTVTAGKAPSGSCPGNWCGGGMLNTGSFHISSPIVSHVIFIGNFSASYGGGMVNTNQGNATLSDVKFINNHADRYGGGLVGIYDTDLTMTDATFQNNSASLQGGGAYFSDNSDPVITSTIFMSNTAQRGGGYYGAAGTNHTLTDVDFIGNSATSTTQDVSPSCNGGGGMCQVGGGVITMTRVTFEKNISQLYGGGLFLDNSGYTATLEDVEFNGNTSVYQGGGLYNTHGNVIVASSVFSGNEATNGISGNGGGVALSGGSLVMSTTTLSGNSGLMGGGLYMNGGTIALTDLVFDSNNASSNGGGMYIYASSFSSIAHSTFTNNTSPYGGGLTSSSSNLIHVDGVTFTQNTASGSGGGFNNQGQAVITNSRFYGNTAMYGGGLRNYQNSATSIENASFVGNRATGFGGGIYAELLDSAWFSITNATMANNTPSHLAYFGENNGSQANNTILSNCILWGSWSSALQYFSDLPVLRYTDVTGGFSGTGNLNMDPVFISTPSSGSDSTWGTADDDYGDVRLKHTSPVIDAGNDADVKAPTDLAGNPRSMGAAVDMGAYEVETLQKSGLSAETLYDFSPQVCGSLWFTSTGTLPTSVTITLTHETPSAGGNGLPRRYEVNVVGGSAYQAQLTLCYEDDELIQAGIDPGQEANLHAYRFTGSPTWEEYSVVDIINNTVTANNVSQFGVWGLGVTGDQPTAITLDTLSAKTGLWKWVWWFWRGAQGLP